MITDRPTQRERQLDAAFEVVGTRLTKQDGLPKDEIATRVHERTETVDEPVVRELVDIERVPVNRIVDATPRTREEGDYLIIPVVEEQIVIEKRLVLKEEIRVRKTRTPERHREDVVLRSEDAEVVRVGGDTEAFEP